MKTPIQLAAVCALAALLSTLSAMAADCSTVKLARALDRLEGKARLHNCEIELVTRQASNGMKQYMLLANDRTPIANGERPPVLFEFEIDGSCAANDSDSLAGKTLSYSYGYATPTKNYKTGITLQMGLGTLPTRLMIQTIDLVSHKIDQRVACALDSSET